MTVLFNPDCKGLKDHYRIFDYFVSYFVDHHYCKMIRSFRETSRIQLNGVPEFVTASRVCMKRSL